MKMLGKKKWLKEVNLVQLWEFKMLEKIWNQQWLKIPKAI
jgi:hypothetical protein